MASEESLQRYVDEAQVNLTHREGQMKIQNDMELLEAHDTQMATSTRLLEEKTCNNWIGRRKVTLKLAKKSIDES